VNVTITVKEVVSGEERLVEIRHISTESHKRLTAHSATRILRREFLDLPHFVAASKSMADKRVFFAMHSLLPTGKCSFHYTWRHYYLVEDLN
jgi:hypothetical protein